MRPSMKPRPRTTGEAYRHDHRNRTHGGAPSSPAVPVTRHCRTTAHSRKDAPASSYRPNDDEADRRNSSSQAICCFKRERPLNGHGHRHLGLDAGTGRLIGSGPRLTARTGASRKAGPPACCAARCAEANDAFQAGRSHAHIPSHSFGHKSSWPVPSTNRLRQGERRIGAQRPRRRYRAGRCELPGQRRQHRGNASASWSRMDRQRLLAWMGLPMLALLGGSRAIEWRPDAAARASARS